MLKLLKPIVFLDIEATGLDLEKDKILELCMEKLNPDGSRTTYLERFNPGIPIPPASTEIHGITDLDVCDKPSILLHAESILHFLDGCDIAGFNSNRYDVPLLYNELARFNCILPYKEMCLIDVGNIFKIKEPRTLAAAAKFYTGQDIENAHSAQADVAATVNVFLEQVERYQLPTDMRELELLSNYGNPILDLSGKFTMNKEGVICLTFGKYKGEPAKDHIEFLDWMLNKANFPQDTRVICRQIIEISYNVPDGN